MGVRRNFSRGGNVRRHFADLFQVADVAIMGVGRGGWSALPPGFWKFQQKGCFLSFEWEKTYFTTFGPLEKFWKNLLVARLPLEKILPTPMVAMQTDVHKTLYSFYITKKILHDSTRSIRIYFEIFFKWSCRLYEFATKVYFLSSVTTFAELAHKYRCHCELHTYESVMDLNYQLRLRLSHLCYSPKIIHFARPQFLGWLRHWHRLSEMLLLLMNCLVSIFESTF